MHSKTLGKPSEQQTFEKNVHLTNRDESSFEVHNFKCHFEGSSSLLGTVRNQLSSRALITDAEENIEDSDSEFTKDENEEAQDSMACNSDRVITDEGIVHH